MRRVAQPACASPVLAAIASGTFESATAMRKAALTLPLTTTVSPSTIDSGMPSSTMPRTMASAEPAAWRPPECLRSEPPIRSMRESPAKKVRDPAQRPRATASFPAGLVERFLDELEGDCADQDTAPEGHDHAERPLSHRVTECKGPADDQGRGGDKAPSERSQHRFESSTLSLLRRQLEYSSGWHVRRIGRRRTHLECSRSRGRSGFPTAFTVLAAVLLFVWIASFFVPANPSAAFSRLALAVGAFIMVTMKTGAIQTGIGRLAAPWPPSSSSERFVGIAAATG